jgi:hypothetical protein
MCISIKETKIPHEITIKAYISLTSALLTCRESALQTDNDITDNRLVIIKVLIASILVTN